LIFATDTVAISQRRLFIFSIFVSVVSFLSVGLVHSASSQEEVGAEVQVQEGAPWAEVTVAAIGPLEHSACPNGALFFANGYKIIKTDLYGHVIEQTQYGTNVAYWTNPKSVNDKHGETYPPLIIYDNQIVKLNNNDLVFTVEGVTWNDDISPHPDWWEITQTYHLKDTWDTAKQAWNGDNSHPGGRGAIYLFKSTDCGKNWVELPKIDFGKMAMWDPSQGAGYLSKPALAGLCGNPRPKSLSAAGQPLSGQPDLSVDVGGPDGHFAYADPFTSDVYISTSCAHGYGTQVNKAEEPHIILRSTDLGTTWGIVAIGANGTWRPALTTLPAERGGVSDVVAVTAEDGKIFAARFRPGNQPFDLGGSSELVSGLGSAGFATDDPFTTAINAQTPFAFMYGYTTLAHHGYWDVLASYADPVDAKGFVTKMGHSNGHDSISQLGAFGQSAQRFETSLFGTLIESPPSWSAKQLLVWLQREPQGSDLVFKMQYSWVPQDTGNKTGILSLDTSGNQTRTGWLWDGYSFFGDYIHGTSYGGPESQHYVVAWTENGALRFNTVHRYSLTSGGGPTGQPPQIFGCKQMREWLQAHCHGAHQLPNCSANEEYFNIKCIHAPPNDP
jgi:hypothetical protein